MRRALLTIVVLLALPAAARAGNTYYVSPSGGGSTCSDQFPCAVGYFFDAGATPMSHYADGDTIVVKSGTYEASTHTFDINHAITLQGEAGPRPIITSGQPGSTSSPVYADQGQHVHITHLDIRATNATGVALHGQYQPTIDDVALTAGQSCVGMNGGSLTDATCTLANGSNGVGIGIAAIDPATLARVTVDATGEALGNGVQFSGGSGSSISDVTVRAPGFGLVVNSPVAIRRVSVRAGHDRGIGLSQGSTLSDSVVVTDGADAINARGSFIEIRNVTAIARGSGVGIVGAANQAAGDQYGDAHIRSSIVRGTPDLLGQAIGMCFAQPCHAGSLSVDHSGFSTKDGNVTDDPATDLADDPLFVDAPGLDFHLEDGSKAIDAGIVDASSGATDLAGAARTQGAAPDMGAFERARAVVPTPTPTPTSTADVTAPKLSKLKGTSSTVTFTLSEVATVTVTVSLRSPGRKHHKACVKPTAKLRKAKSCTRLVTKARLKKTVAAGAAKLKLTKKLGRGSYTLSAVAVDAANNKAKAVTASLKVR